MLHVPYACEIRTAMSSIPGQTCKLRKSCTKVHVGNITAVYI